MNHLGKLTLCAVLLAAVSACNRAPDGDQPAEGSNAQPALNEARITNETLLNGAAAEPAKNAAPETRAAIPAAPDRARPPKATQPPPDPHAGHDMGNMSNMSR